ncbi:DBH-like monooxygenase protein 1 [Liolophura sinensis]|uniref:DBH-like monooxygenase protein 1 n=1 Tax=Liolophura sinensis TaxID=3198878 RepID=UPI0031593903
MIQAVLLALAYYATGVAGEFTWGNDAAPLPHSMVLDAGNNYHVSWNFNEEYFWFQVTVKTLGYVGLGFSPNGGMKGSDIVIGGVDDASGRGYLSDRHAVGQSEPLVDTNQDYTLHYSHQNDTHTVLQISRKLQLCSGEDHFLKEETVRLIWAYNDADPSTEGSIQYHGANKGNKNVYLLNAQRKAPPLPDNVIIEDFLNNKTVIPSKSTTYWCQAFAVPKLKRKHHVIKVEPIIQPGHESEVHHILLYGCNHNVSEETPGKAHECYHRNMPPDFWGCSSVMVAWAVGGEDIYFPEHVGLPFGYEEDPTMLLMETHYDNPQNKEGLVDSSGFRLTLTPDLRDNDAGIFEVGEVVGPGHIIPPFAESFRTVGQCFPECLEQALKGRPEGVKVFGTMLHSHLLGHAMRVRHFRQGAYQQLVAEDNNYDFNYQYTRIMGKEIDVLPGDHFITECDYRSTDRKNITLGGLSTRQEMCLGFLMYYPKIKLANCQSTPTPQYLSSFLGVTINPQYTVTAPPEHAGKGLHDILRNNVDWKNDSVREAFQQWAEKDGVDGFFVECSYGLYNYPIDGNVRSISKTSTLPTGETCTSGCLRPHLSELFWALSFIALFAYF